MTGDVDSRNSNLRVLFFFFFLGTNSGTWLLSQRKHETVSEIQITKMCYFVYHIHDEYIAGYRWVYKLFQTGVFCWCDTLVNDFGFPFFK